MKPMTTLKRLLQKLVTRWDPASSVPLANPPRPQTEPVPSPKPPPVPEPDPVCELCGLKSHDSSWTLKQYAASLRYNLSYLGVKDQQIEAAQFVCSACKSARELARCCKTGAHFPEAQNCISKFRGSQMHKNMTPHHPSSQLSGFLSPLGYNEIEKEHADIQHRFRTWCGGSTGEYLREYRIVREIKIIKDDQKWGSPVELEQALKWQAVQVGGNGYIKFFYTRHEAAEETYIAGRGKKGNPFYKTRRVGNAHFTGCAMAVLAQSLHQPKSQKADTEKPKREPRSPVKTEKEYAALLCLTGKVTRDQIESAYREQISKYHPDKVAHLGSDLKKFAEERSKLLNEAILFFRLKYNR